MTPSDASRLVAVVRLLWPHATLPDETPKMWHSFLKDFPMSACEDAVREFAVTGREFPPTVGMVVAKLAERDSDVPDWDEVRAEILRLIKRYGVYDPPSADRWSHSLIAEFMEAAWQEWCMSVEGDGTFNAQQREAWKALAARSQRERSLQAVGAPRNGGLKGGGLRRLDPLKGIEPPRGAA